MTTRGQILAIEQLVAWQQQGGFTLPAGLTAAFEMYQAATALPLPQAPPVRHPDTAAAAVLDALRAGKTPDLAGAGRDLLDAQRESEAVTLAGRVAAIAVERAAERAVGVASVAADAIITEVLRPAYADLLDQARTLAPNVAGHNLDDGGWSAPPRVRDARSKLAELAARHQLLRAARRRAVQLSSQQVEHDTAGVFVSFQHPERLVPGWTPSTPLLPPTLPSDPVAALLFVVTEAWTAGPWLPSGAEQDAAWDDLYGDAHRERQALHISARAHSGAPV